MSMSSIFNYVVCAIKESNTFKVLSVDELHGSFLVHAHKIQLVKEEDQVLTVSIGARMAWIDIGCGALNDDQDRGKRFNKKCHRVIQMPLSV